MRLSEALRPLITAKSCCSFVCCVRCRTRPSSRLITGVGLWQLDKMMTSTKELMAVPLAKERLVSDRYPTIYGGSRRTLAIAKSSDNSLVAFFAKDSVKGSKRLASS